MDTYLIKRQQLLDRPPSGEAKGQPHYIMRPVAPLVRIDGGVSFEERATRRSNEALTSARLVFANHTEAHAFLMLSWHFGPRSRRVLPLFLVMRIPWGLLFSTFLRLHTTVLEHLIDIADSKVLAIRAAASRANMDPCEKGRD